MTNMKYISSEGKEYDLHGKFTRITSGNVHQYKWNALSRKQNNEHIVEGFEKEILKYKFTLTIRGSEEEKKNFLNNLIDSAEYDIANMSPGIFRHDDYYIKGYIISSDSRASEIRPCWAQDEIEIICPFPFWISEKKLSFGKYNGSGSNNFLNYPYNYPYNYTGINKGFSQINNEHYNSVHFRMTIYGPCVNPMIIIGGHTYIVNTIVGENEYLEIDSRNRTVIKTLIDGTKVNEFNNRGFESETFEKIPPGVLPVNWSGEYGFDIVLFYERSEPKWIQK